MRLDPVLIAAIALAVSITAFLVGPSIAPRTISAIRSRRASRKHRQDELLKYLIDAALFFDGLALFIEKTWGWGPSVPNYAAGGSFPHTQLSGKRLDAVKSTVTDGLGLYELHSRMHGTPFPAKHDALQRVRELEEDFWRGCRALIKSEWRLRHRRVERHLRELSIPPSEVDRIATLVPPHRVRDN